MHNIIPSTLPPDLAAELFSVVREANRLAREGGSVDERAVFHGRKQALLERIEQFEADATRRAVEAHELAEAVHASKERARAAYCLEVAHCQDWPLCGHDKEATRLSESAGALPCEGWDSCPTPGHKHQSFHDRLGCPPWCEGGHDGTHHERTIDGLVRITWTDTIDGEPNDDGPLVQVLADEHLELDDAQRLVAALTRAADLARA